MKTSVELDKLLEAEVITIGRSLLVSEGYKSGHYVYWVEEGTLCISYQDQVREVGPGELLWLGAGHERKLWTAGPARWCIVRVRNRLFGPNAPVERMAFEILVGISRLSRQCPHLELSQETRRAIDRLFGEMVKKNVERGGVIRRKGLLLEMLGQLAGDACLGPRLEETLQKDHAVVRLHEVLALVEKEAVTGSGVEELARKAGMSRSTLHRLLRKNGLPDAGRLMRQTRLENAQRLLDDGQHSIAGAAMESGFQSLSSFYRAYGRRYGRPPGGGR